MIIDFECLGGDDYFDQESLYGEDEEWNFQDLERNVGLVELSQPEAQSDSERLQKTGLDSDSDAASVGENEVEFDASDIRDLEQQLAEICQPCDGHEAEAEKKVPQVSFGNLQKCYPEFELEKVPRVSLQTLQQWYPDFEPGEVKLIVQPNLTSTQNLTDLLDHFRCLGLTNCSPIDTHGKKITSSVLRKNRSQKNHQPKASVALKNPGHQSLQKLKMTHW